MTARPGPRRTAVPPGAAGASAGAEAARTRRSAWAALVLLVGGLSLGVVLALVGGPWQVLAVLHLGALAIWFLVWRRSWRDLLRSAGPRSPWLLFAVSASLCALSAVAHHPIDNPGAVLAPVTPTGLLSALAMALGVGVLMNAVPEEFSLRRCLLEPLRERPLERASGDEIRLGGGDRLRPPGQGRAAGRHFGLLQQSEHQVLRAGLLRI